MPAFANTSGLHIHFKAVCRLEKIFSDFNKYIQDNFIKGNFNTGLAAGMLHLLQCSLMAYLKQF